MGVQSRHSGYQNYFQLSPVNNRSDTIVSPDDFVLSIYPKRVTAGHLKLLLSRHDEEAKKQIIAFIYHRLHHRYIVPLFKVPKKFRSGFLMMASACLMIETMQAFYTGKKETKGKSRNSFKAFFERNGELFPGLAAHEEAFFYDIRCGILHQAESRRGYRILRSGPLFDARAKTINAEAFLKALKRALAGYIVRLRGSKEPAFWENAVNKVGFICDNCRSDVKRERPISVD